MPTSSSPSTSKRLLTLLSLLQSRRDWSAPVLAGRLEVSERTVRRDVERLREVDYVIETTRGPDGGYRLAAGTELPPLLFDDEQAVVIALALRTAGALGTDLDEAAERALRTIRRLLPSRLAHRIDGLAASAGTATRPAEAHADAGVLLRIGDAIRDALTLRFDYDSFAGPADAEPAARTTEPHHLVLAGGRWYLIGWTPERDDWRTYRVDRIRLRSHTGASFTPRSVPGGDPAAFLSARFKGSTGADTWPCGGSAILDADAVQIAPYLGDGTLSVEPDGRCRIRVGSWSWPGVAASIARFDAPITDVEPVELRAAFARLAARAVDAARPGDDTG
ncbi:MULTISPECIES: WYL domain-containing protein [unclassified Rathayibacter]|uniref:helix-turn-helix transcriptional regulator n=1 Tax=unclassified Rathayibacter TaxID=2609250 RepID=UPI001052DF02|nr:MULTISPECIES: WYL domain-containing protein [unclassified Rathayibacter]TCL84974.1 HTH domain-containing protein [Rathayibacter sp. PhB192]TCM30692.1 HTH domain-containing protein [Rathayibacter sp. PhB179]